MKFKAIASCNHRPPQIESLPSSSAFATKMDQRDLPKTPSVFSQLTENFKNLNQCVSFSACEKKIDPQSVCNECESRFCTECLSEMSNTKTCATCRATDSIRATQNPNDLGLVNKLIPLFELFAKETNMSISSNPKCFQSKIIKQNELDHAKLARLTNSL